MLRQQIDLRHSQFFLDTCAFDPKDAPEQEAADAIWRLYEADTLQLVLAHSNQREVDHPNTPDWVKRQAQSMVFTLTVDLNSEETQRRDQIISLLKGNSESDRHLDDAHHIFEASKYGGYFLTTDNRLLKLAQSIFDCCSVQVMKPSDALRRIELGQNASRRDI